MNEPELKSLWMAYQEKNAPSLQISQKNAGDITRMKAQNLLSSVRPLKVLALVAGVLWVLALTPVLFNLFLHSYGQVSLFFLYSASLQVAITAAAVAVYAYQLHLMHRLDFGGSVIDIQRRLSRLQIATLWAARLLVLQLPLWTTFYLSETLVTNGDPAWLLFQGLASATALALALWLFFNIKYENRDKIWFKRLFGGKEWRPILQAMDMLTQLTDYEQEAQ